MSETLSGEFVCDTVDVVDTTLNWLIGGASTIADNDDFVHFRIWFTSCVLYMNTLFFSFWHWKNFSTLKHDSSALSLELLNPTSREEGRRDVGEHDDHVLHWCFYFSSSALGRYK